MPDEAAQQGSEVESQQADPQSMEEAVRAMTEAAVALKESLTNNQVEQTIGAEVERRVLQFIDEAEERLRTIDANIAKIAGSPRAL